MKEENFGGIHNAIDDLDGKFKSFEGNNSEKIKLVKQQLKDLEETFLNKVKLSLKKNTF